MQNLDMSTMKDVVVDLAQKKLLGIRPDEERGIAILKYSRRAFWKGAFKDHEFLNYARGLVVNWPECDRIVSRPLVKVFNPFEELAPKFELNTSVLAIEKVNGFMATATWHNDDLLITTSGTFDSEFVGYAKEYLDCEAVRFLCENETDFTFIFEIAHPIDPHIFPEKFGAHLIGAALKSRGIGKWWMALPKLLEYFYHQWLEGTSGFHLPSYQILEYGDVLALAKVMPVEGWMVYNLDDIGDIHDRSETNYTAFYDALKVRTVKIKTRAYLIRKFLARNRNKTPLLFNDPESFADGFDEDILPIVNAIVAEMSEEDWVALDERQRLEFLDRMM